MRWIVRSGPGPDQDGLLGSAIAQRDLENLLIAVLRNAVLVATGAGGEPQAAVHGRLDRTQPAVGAHVVLLDLGQPVTVDHRTVQPGAAETGDVQDVTNNRDATAGRRR